MVIDELFKVFSWLSFSSTHCDVLEERSKSVVETMKELQTQQKDDELLFQRERRCIEEVHRNLGELAKAADAIEKAANEALPEMKAQEKAYVEQLERMQNVASALFVSDAVLMRQEQILESLTKTQDAINHIQEGVRKL